jgi:hypothetical protein
VFKQGTVESAECPDFLQKRFRNENQAAFDELSSSKVESLRCCACARNHFRITISRQGNVAQHLLLSR